MSSKNVLVINFDSRETRVALIENGIIAELHIERRGTAKSSVGNVYLGKITRVLPGLQAAFIDIGQERAAFLHVEDLIRPNDFDTYLSGARKPERDEVASTDDADVSEKAEAATSVPELPADVAPVVVEPSNTPLIGAEDSSEEIEVSGASSHEASDPSEEVLEAGEEGDEDDEEDDAETEGADDDDDAEPVESSDVLEAVPASSADVEPLSRDGVASAPEVSGTEDDDEVFGDMPGFTITEPGEPVPRAAPPPRGGGSEGGGRGRGRGRGGRSGGRRGRGRGGRDDQPRGESNNRQGARPQRSSASLVPERLSKTTPIKDVVKEGQEVIVQVTKDPIGTKGARVSSHVSLPGRYVVYLPTVEHVGVSKRIGSDKERARLREAIDSVKPPTGGLIVRTLAEGLTKKLLKQDVGYLVRLWEEIAKNREPAKAPATLMSELDLVLKIARDLFTDEVDQIVIDDKNQYDRLCRFVEMFAPERVKDVQFYAEEEPIFDAYGIEDEMQRALSRKVPLPSGGHLIIDQAEALTAIDVNTGRFVGKGSKDMEETILKTNLEAVHEIAYQLRFRNIGGLIILDLIDMEKAQNREKVRRALESVLEKDKAKTTLNRISELGLIEMTRKRTRESLGRILNEPCFYCDGTGQLQSKETIAYEIIRDIHRKRNDLAGYSIVINAHPAVADVLNGPERGAITETENRYMRKIHVVARKEYHLEQFDLQGK